MINVSQPYIPNKLNFDKRVRSIFDSKILTNSGKLLKELESHLESYLGVDNVICVSNGTIALQVAYKAFNLQGEVITTPFSYIATTSSLLWEGLNPVFCDICPDTLNINTSLLAKYINKNTSALVPVHVFGNPCEVEAISSISKNNDLKVIYDAAHAFNIMYESNNQQINILNFGDISTLSFHATKIFHTIEGGAVITNDDNLASKIRAMINFGIDASNNISIIGTNAKMSEFQAAMGLCVLEEYDAINYSREKIWNRYKNALSNDFEFPKWNNKATNNYSYVPIIFDSEESLLRSLFKLNEDNIYPRRYFYPSLNTTQYFKPQSYQLTCPISEDISKRILCLPIYPGLKDETVDFISDSLLKSHK